MQSDYAVQIIVYNSPKKRGRGKSLRRWLGDRSKDFHRHNYGAPSPIMSVPPIIDAVKALIGFVLAFQYYFFETKNLFFAHGDLFKA